MSFLVDLEGVDVNSRHHLGRTPLFLVVNNWQSGVVHRLCKKADVEQDVMDSIGNTLRMAAQNNEDLTMLAILGSFNLQIEEPPSLTVRDFLHLAGFVIVFIALCWQIGSLV